MAHHGDERTTMHGVLDILVEHGLEGMAEAMATMLNEAIKIERSTAERARLCRRLWGALSSPEGEDWTSLPSS